VPLHLSSHHNWLLISLYLLLIAEVLRHPKVYSFLHIPVQAGSDRVLTAMNREYTVAEFRTVADYLLVMLTRY